MPKVNNRGMVVWLQTGTDFINRIYLYNNGNISQYHSVVSLQQVSTRYQ